MLQKTYLKLILGLLANLIAVAIYLAWPQTAFAQEPQACVSGTSALTVTYSFTTTASPFGVMDAATYDATLRDVFNPLLDPFCGSAAGTYVPGTGFRSVQICSDNHHKLGFVSSGVTYSSPITGSSRTSVSSAISGNSIQMFCFTTDNEWIYLGDSGSLSTLTYIPYGTTCTAIGGAASRGSGVGVQIDTSLRVTCGAGEYPPPAGFQQCPLVQNANFETEEEQAAWLLDGTAVITSGTLTLGPGDIAAQNLTLQANKTYNAVISVTQVAASTPLNIVLGTDSEILTIEEPGLYTATFTTPANLVGPIVYDLENEGDDSLILDFTCVSLFVSGSVGGECLAPQNGTFENKGHWNWYRGADLFVPGKYASLPLADNGMIGTSETYTMPTLAEGEHLLLGFTARGLDDGGVVSGQVTNGGSTAEFNYSTYPAEYSYETSLDTLAEETSVQLSFVNPGDVITDVLSTADVVMDNVCVFIADRGPNLPTPVDPDGISPIDPGFQGIQSCADLDGIWAGFGVNIPQYRADYEAGASIWDPIGWVPWLIAALFVNLSNWSCFFFAAFLSVVDLVTYFLNSVMNIGNWLVRMWPAFVAWLSGWNDWLAGSLANISNAIGNALAAWSNWIGDALWATSTAIGLTLAAASDWIAATLANLSNGIAAFLSDWSDWIAASLANLSDWIAATLATLWDWLASYFTSLNGLRIIVNWLIDAWNALLGVIGQVLGNILDVLIGIWNDSLYPFLAAAWAWISQTPGTIAAFLIDFFTAAWDLLIMVFLWLWENVISVGHLPLTFYYAFDDGINADPYGLVSCAGENFWCTFLAGVQLINQLWGHSILYPITIVGIIISTLWILWDNVKELFSIEIS